MKRNGRISIQLSPEIAQRLTLFVKHEEMPQTEVIHEALRRFFREQGSRSARKNLTRKAKALAALEANQRASVRRGLNKMTQEEINAEIHEYRKTRRK